MVVEKYSEKKQPINQLRKINLPVSPSCKRKTWIEFDKGFYCPICNIILKNKNFQWIKEVLKQERLPYADEKIGELYSEMVNTKYDTTQDMIDKYKS